MNTVSTVLIQVRDKVDEERERLQKALDETTKSLDILVSARRRAQELLDDLDRFANDAEAASETIAASDLEPDSYSLLPERSGLVYADPTIDRRLPLLRDKPDQGHDVA